MKNYFMENFLKSDAFLKGILDTSPLPIFVKDKDGYILLKVIQLPGKRKMEISALLNGYKFEKDAKVS